MNCKSTSLLALFIGTAATSYSIAARSSETPQQYDPRVLAQVEAFYGISEEAAIVRLDKEYAASVQARRIEELQLPGYAGAWFDGLTLALRVAVNSDADVEAVEELGATPVRVAHALTDLESAREELTGAMDSALGGGAVRESYVDFQANGLVVGVTAENLAQASEYLRAHPGFSVPVQLVTAREDVDFSSNLYGADGTRNHTWEVIYSTSQPCSVGASAERITSSGYVAGYVTAGHCNSVDRSTGVGDIIYTSGGTSLGQAVWSSFDIGPYLFHNNEDGAWVQTNAGWTPQPKINGYSSGTLTVSGTWAGTLEAPVGTTACRYGGSSGGPHCAAISAKNVTACFTGCTITIKGLSMVNGICTNAGDSGGPLITPANQVQGTDTGGTLNSCPDSSTDYVYFQPITTTLSRANSVLIDPLAMLTSHGRSAPTFSAMSCPAPGSASGQFICIVGAYDSQGETTMSWSTNTGDTSTTGIVKGSCGHNQTVIVTLSATNPYGTTTSTKSFLCPWGPPV